MKSQFIGKHIFLRATELFALLCSPKLYNLKHESMVRSIIITAILSAIPFTSFAQQPDIPAATPSQNIVDEIQADGIISVEIPQGVYDRLQPIESQTEGKEMQQPSSVGRMAGYRIQAFSGNSANAKREGQARESQVRSSFPEYKCYLVYNAPYWRLRVGDFRTRAEADEAAATIKRAFPAFRREITVVRDRISPNY